MRLFVYLFCVTFLTSLTKAADLESCGRVSKLEGVTCKDLKVTFDLSECGEGKDPVEAKVQCDNEIATSTFKSSTSNYRAIFELKSAAWGKTEYQLKGNIWRHVRKTKEKPPVVKKAPAVVVPLVASDVKVEKQSEALAPPAPVVAVPPAVVEAKSKVREEDLAALVNLLSGLSFKGSIDTYYAYNSNKPAVLPAVPTAAAPQTQNKYHVFDSYHDDLQFNYAHLQIQKNSDAFSFNLDMAYGPAMQVISGTKTDAGQMNVKQAVIGYKATDKLTIEAGRFATYLGYETIESQDNWNYSRGLLFGYFVPFWHQGVKATYAFNDQVSLMGMAANGWNNSYEDNRQKTYGGQLTWIPNTQLSFYLNAISGQDFVPAGLNPLIPNDTRTVYDLVAVYKPTEKISFALNYDYYQHATFKASGAALYARYQIDEKWALAGRYESVEDKENLAIGESLPQGQTLSSATLTLEKKLDSHFTLKIEGRTDRSSEEVFSKEGNPSSTQTIGIIGLTGGF